MVRAAPDEALDHRDQDGRGLREAVAPQPAIPLLDRADHGSTPRAGQAGRTRPRERGQHDLELRGTKGANGIAVLVDDRQHRARPSTSGARRNAAASMVEDGDAGVLHDVGLLVATSASLIEADASANPRGLRNGLELPTAIRYRNDRACPAYPSPRMAPRRQATQPMTAPRGWLLERCRPVRAQHGASATLCRTGSRHRTGLDFAHSTRAERVEADRHGA